MNSTDYIVLGDRLYTATENILVSNVWLVNDARTGRHCGGFDPELKFLYCSYYEETMAANYWEAEYKNALKNFHDFFLAMGYKLHEN